jgi:hypothetical protein
MGGGWYFIIHLSDWLIKNIAACHNVSHFPYFLVIIKCEAYVHNDQKMGEM